MSPFKESGLGGGPPPGPIPFGPPGPPGAAPLPGGPPAPGGPPLAVGVLFSDVEPTASRILRDSFVRDDGAADLPTAVFFESLIACSNCLV